MIEKKRFWLAAAMIVAGITMLFIAMYIDPKGEISSTVLGGVGEIFVLAGSLLSLDQYVTYKMKKFIDNEKK